MTISKVNPPTWGVGAKLTSAQANSFDDKIITALDKTSAGDTLSGKVQCSGVGRIIDSYVVGADADTTYSAGTASTIVVPNTITANRVYTFNTTGASTGDQINVLCKPGPYTITLVDDPSLGTIATLGGQTGTVSLSCNMIYTGAGGWVAQTFAPRRSNVRFFSSVANLQADTDHVLGDVAVIPSYGTFYYDTAYGAGLSDTLQLIKPTDVLLASNGRWLTSDPISYAKVIAQGSGTSTPTSVSITTGGFTLMESTSVVATSLRGGATMRLLFRFSARASSSLSGAPTSGLQPGIDYKVTVQEGAGTIVTGEVFRDQIMPSGQQVDSDGHGFIECLLPDGNGTYTVRLYAMRDGAGYVFNYSNFEYMNWNYQIIETP